MAGCALVVLPNVATKVDTWSSFCTQFKTRKKSIFFEYPLVPEVLETIQPPLHQAYHSGPTHNLNRFLLPISFRPRPEDPKSTLIHFQHGGSGNWMPLFKRFKLFLKVFFCWQKTSILLVTGCLPLEFLCCGSFKPEEFERVK